MSDKDGGGKGGQVYDPGKADKGNLFGDVLDVLDKLAGPTVKNTGPTGYDYTGAKTARGGSGGSALDIPALSGTYGPMLQGLLSPGQRASYLAPRPTGQVGQLGAMQLQLQRPGAIGSAQLGPQLCRPVPLRRASSGKRRKKSNKRCSCRKH